MWRVLALLITVTIISQVQPRKMPQRQLKIACAGLGRMGEMSSRLRDDSKKYRKAAVKINWDLLIKQYAPIGVFALIVLLFIWFRFF
ncbi:hypothetical protein NUW58_g1826 [Xylaria curta]|uniref:Uncharacterized protein n=1 Tax=Xylaria curta TaxID=42375 RepID=A0ACC1PIG0_9PEZI|nr:hypothetical protein NUW58_g1826 [Xylaria curta]